jgi:hypothetical protein
VAQDLVYHQVHLFVGNNDIDTWQAILEKLADRAYDTILPDTGCAKGPEVLTQNAEYLAAARELLDDDGQAYKQAIVEPFPDYTIPFVIDISTCYLLGNRPA